MGDVIKLQQSNRTGAEFAASMGNCDITGTIYEDGEINFNLAAIEGGDRQALESLLTLATAIRMKLPERPTPTEVDDG